MDLLSNLKNKISSAKEQHFLALEIGSRIIKAIIVKITDTKAYIIGTGTQDLLFEQIKEGQIRHIRSVADSTEIAIDKAIQLAGVKPKFTIVSPASPDFINQTQKIVYRRPKPSRRLDRSELTDIFSQLNQRLTVKFQRNHQGYELVNSVILATEIDGTTVKSPLDFTGQELSFLVYQSYLPLIQLGAYQSVIDDLKLNVAGLVSQPYAIYKAFNPQSYQYKNALFIDVGGSLTEIIINRDGQLLQIENCGQGGDFFTVGLAEQLNVSPDKAEQYKRDYIAGLLTRETESDLHNLFTSMSDQWVNTMEDKLSSVITNDIPWRIFLSGGGILLPELVEAVKNSQLLSMAKISWIHAIDLENLVDKTNTVNQPYFISCLALAANGLNYQPNKHQSNNLYQRFIQTLRT